LRKNGSLKQKNSYLSEFWIDPSVEFK